MTHIRTVNTVPHFDSLVKGSEQDLRIKWISGLFSGSKLVL